MKRSNLKEEIEKPSGAELDFECDMCGQRFYEDEGVESEPLYFGEPPTPKTVSSRGIQEKQAQRIGFNTETNDFTTEAAQVLGYPVDELAAIIQAFEKNDRFEVETKRRVLEMPEKALVVEDPENPEVADFSDRENDDKVAATVAAKPEESTRTPDAVVCEYCRGNIGGDEDVLGDE